MRKGIVNTTLAAAAAVTMMAAVATCGHGGGQAKPAQGGHHQLPDTLVVGTLYSPTGFFILRGDTLGYDFDRAKDFAAAKGVGIKFKVAKNLQSLVEMLRGKQIDMIACEVPETAEFKSQVLNCGAADTTYQVLVQPKSQQHIANVTQLVGRDVYVIAKSRYEARLKNLDNELGGGIRIRTVDNDTLIAEDLIAMVAAGKLPLTIVDSDIARFDKTYYDNIDVSLNVSFPQRSSWAVNKADQWLADSVDNWSNSVKGKAVSKELKRRYFELSKSKPAADSNGAHSHTTVGHGGISPYDHLFKAHARHSAWEWQLLAAIGKTESGFNPKATSWAGAVGLMQVMPGVGRSYGASRSQLADPDKSVEVAVKILNGINAYLKPRVRNREERLKFVLAAYNAGIGHVADAIALAKKYGKDPQVWYGNVEEAISWKSNPDFYNDPVCRYGYFRGRQTIAYVKEVERHYRHYKSRHK